MKESIVFPVKVAEVKTAEKMLKDYYGDMLSCGVTTFWEDLDLKWFEDCGIIDEAYAIWKKRYARRLLRLLLSRIQGKPLSRLVCRNNCVLQRVFGQTN